MYIIKMGINTWLKIIHPKKDGADERFYKLAEFCPYTTEDFEEARIYSSLSSAFEDLYKILDYNPKLRPVIELR